MGGSWKGLSLAAWACTVAGSALTGACLLAAVWLVWGLASGTAFDEAPIVMLPIVGFAAMGLAMAVGPWVLRDTDQSPEATGVQAGTRTGGGRGPHGGSTASAGPMNAVDRLSAGPPTHTVLRAKECEWHHGYAVIAAVRVSPCGHDDHIGQVVAELALEPEEGADVLPLAASRR